MTKSSGSKSPFYAEDLDGKVRKPATFYVTINNTMIRGIDLRQISKTRTFPSAPWKTWPNDPFLVEQELPPEMGRAGIRSGRPRPLPPSSAIYKWAMIRLFPIFPISSH
ncbi:MAG: hypothetical protein JKP98_08695 [Rhodobacteraceae bacterium]|nr:hypothetical protein [Paracoccaceae bacterium]